MRCPKCGGTIPRGRHNCPDCEYELTRDEYRKYNAKRRPVWPALLAVAAVLAVGAGGLWLLRGLPPGSGPDRTIPAALTQAPTAAPTQAPTAIPTQAPTSAPAWLPTAIPTMTVAPLFTSATLPTAAPAAPVNAVFPALYGVKLPDASRVDSVEALIQDIICMMECGQEERTFSGLGFDGNRLGDATMCFEDINESYFITSGDKLTIRITWEAGTRIWQAVKYGRESRLSARDRDILARCRAALGQIIRPGMTVIEKERAIHDYICQNCSYLIDKALNTHNCYGFFDHGKLQCAGYADLFQLLCRLEDIWCFTISGTASDGDQTVGDDSHSWSLVFLDGKWYAVDVTWDDWDDGTWSYGYFNIPLNCLSATRTWNRAALPPGALAVDFDEKWGYGACPCVTGIDEAADRVTDALARGQEIVLRLPTGMDVAEICKRVASRFTSGTIWNCALLDKTWAHVVRFYRT